MTTIGAEIYDRINLKELPALSNLYPKSVSEVAGLVGLQLATCVFGLGFTDANSLLRPALLPIVGGSVWVLGQTCQDVMPRIILSDIVGSLTCRWLTQYVVSGLLKQDNFEDGGPTVEKGGKVVKRREGGTIIERVLFGLGTVNSQRNIGTPQQVKNVPVFWRKDPHYVPSKHAFLLRTGLKMVGAYLLLDLMTSGEADVSQNPIFFAAGKVPLLSRLGDVSSSELALRANISLGHWFGSYVFLQMVHSTLAFWTVLPNIYEPRDWPLLFGSIFEIYSIRQYWSVFYHQLMRYKLETISSFITEEILHIPSGTLFKRYADILGVFFVSGVCHVMMNVWGSIPLRECGAIQFFCTQAFGIMVEDGVQALYRKCKGVKRTKTKPKAWIRVLGFGWTIAFLVWSTPAWIYPGLRRATRGPKAQLLPFSVVNWVLGKSQC